MSGDSLADWQTIVKALNERIQAMGGFKLSSLTQIPVPTTKDHITQAFANAVGNSVVQCFTKRYNTTGWCVPANPLIIIHPGDPDWGGYQTGNYLYGPNFWISGFNTWGGIDSKSIYEEVPSFGSIPLRGSELEKIGDFLDWCGNTLKLLIKSSCGTCVTKNTGAARSFRWTISTGEIYDTLDYSSPIGTASTYSDFYTFALAHLTPWASTGNPYCRKRVYNNGGTFVYLNLEYCSCPVRYGYGTGTSILTTPGMINADLTIYYSSFGDDCGYAVNSSSTHTDYSTVTFQNVGPEFTVNFGFDISSISIAPTMPTAGNEIEIKENLENIYAVWDFTNYFQYCV